MTPHEHTLNERGAARSAQDRGAMSASGATEPRPEDLVPLVIALDSLEDALALERTDQLELVRTMLSTLEIVIKAQADAQREIAQLRRRVNALDPSGRRPPVPAGDQDSALTAVDGHQALREQTSHARRHSQEARKRAAALSGRASELMAESQRLTNASPLPRSRSRR
jgi:hypothetical protein